MASLARPTAYRIGSYRLDLEKGVLLAHGDRPIALRPKTFSMLCLLAENAGKLMSSDDIMDAVWPGIFVTQNSINQCVHEIRRAFGDTGALILRTVARRGFRLSQPVFPEFATSPRPDARPQAAPAFLEHHPSPHFAATTAG